MLLIVRLLLVAHQRTEHGIVFHVVPIDHGVGVGEQPGVAAVRKQRPVQFSSPLYR